VGTTRGREVLVGEGPAPAPAAEEAPVWCVVAAYDATAMVTGDGAGAPAEGASTSAVKAVSSQR
jgi:hypothetical protein